MKDSLKSEFNMKDFGKVKTALSMQFDKAGDGSMKVYQKRYISDVLKQFGMQDYKPAAMPIETGWIV